MIRLYFVRLNSNHYFYNYNTLFYNISLNIHGWDMSQ